MKTRIKLVAMFALVAIISTGCASVTKGTHRSVTIDSNITPTTVSINNGQPVQLPTVLKLGTRRNSGDIHLLARTADGREQERILTWQMKDGKWFLAGGAVGWGVVCGIPGLAISLGTDLITRAAYDLDVDHVSFQFGMNGAPQRQTQQQIVAVPIAPVPVQTVYVTAPPQPQIQQSSQPVSFNIIQNNGPARRVIIRQLPTEE